MSTGLDSTRRRQVREGRPGDRIAVIGILFPQDKKDMDSKRPVADTHIHLWDPDRLTYPWLETVPAIADPHGPAELQAQEAETDRFQLTQIVFMQAGAEDAEAVREARWVDSLADTVDSRITGIVADAPVNLGEGSGRCWRKLASHAPGQGDPPPDPGPAGRLRGHPGVSTAGVRMLPRYGFSFDLCIRHHQLGEVTDLVRRCPEVAFILDHIGKPDIAAGTLDPWRGDLKILSELPNVVCKISGMATEADHANWQPLDLKPYVDHVVECFGEDRIVYGGDWPVRPAGAEALGPLGRRARRPYLPPGARGAAKAVLRQTPSASTASRPDSAAQCPAASGAARMPCP